MTTTTDAANGQVSYLYDQLGQLIRVTDRRGLATPYTKSLARRGLA